MTEYVALEATEGHPPISILDMQGGFSEAWVGGALHIQGQSQLRCPTGDHHNLHPDTAMLMRVDQPGSRFQL